MSNNVVVPRHTVQYSLHFVWTRVFEDDSTGGMILWIRVSDEGKTFRMWRINVSITRGLPSTISQDYRSPLLVPRRMRHHAVLVTDFGHRFDVLITKFYQQCEVGCAQILFVETCYVSIVDVCTCTCFQHDFQQHHASPYTEETAEEAMAPQLNEKGWITRSQVDLAAARNKQARYAAVRCVQAACRGSMKRIITQLRYQCRECAQWTIGATRCDD